MAGDVAVIEARGEARGRTAIPTPKGLPVIGHLHQIARAGLIGHLLSVSREFPGGVFNLKFGSRIGVFVTDPDVVAMMADGRFHQDVFGFGK